jgi:hypothetical protein
MAPIPKIDKSNNPKVFSFSVCRLSYQIRLLSIITFTQTIKKAFMDSKNFTHCSEYQLLLLRKEIVSINTFKSLSKWQVI